MSIFELFGNKYRNRKLQTFKNVCVLVAVVLKRVHNLLKEILKIGEILTSLVKKEKALSPSNPACRLNKIVWNHCFDFHWLKARVALLVKLLNLLWFKHFFFLMHPCFDWPWNALSHPFWFFRRKCLLHQIIWSCLKTLNKYALLLFFFKGNMKV